MSLKSERHALVRGCELTIVYTAFHSGRHIYINVWGLSWKLQGVRAGIEKRLSLEYSLNCWSSHASFHRLGFVSCG